MKKKICILTQSHLCRNPRVVKEANALAEAGYHVKILTTFTYADLLQEDRQLIDPAVELVGVVNMIESDASKWNRLFGRAERRLAGEAVARFGWQSPRALGYHYSQNLKAAKAEMADLYLCHQEASTVIGVQLLKAGHKVGFDFEDWYSRDLLPDANRTRPLRLLESVEMYALQNSPLCYTTSRAMAAAMADFAHSAEPKVLHNVFPWAERQWMDGQFKDRTDMQRPSLHWYSQTIGPGRGLEFIVDAMNDINIPVQLHLRGKLFGNFGQSLIGRLDVTKGHSIHFHPLVPHRELLSRIAEHDIGLATEEYNPPSRNLTITNKILQYLLAGIPVLATDTQGQKEVAADAPGAVWLFEGNNRARFAQTLQELLQKPEALKAGREKALQTAKAKYCWENEAPNLVEWVSKTIDNQAI